MAAAELQAKRNQGVGVRILACVSLLFCFHFAACVAVSACGMPFISHHHHPMHDLGIVCHLCVCGGGGACFSVFRSFCVAVGWTAFIRPETRIATRGVEKGNGAAHECHAGEVGVACGGTASIWFFC